MANEEIENLPIYINDRANIRLSEIRSTCQTLARKGKCGLITIDYFQLLDVKTSNGSIREQQIAEASRSAKLLSKELNVPVILFSQLNRSIESRTTGSGDNIVAPTPMLSDLRESGAIEQDADVVLFIDRPIMYGAISIDTGMNGLISTRGMGYWTTKHFPYNKLRRRFNILFISLLRL